MKRLATLMMAGLVLAGCKKLTDTTPDPDEKVKMINTKGNLSVGSPTGTGFGAQQAVRKAAARPVNFNDLKQLQIFIVQAETENGQVPNANDIMQIVGQAGSIVKAINDGVIILTNNTQREGIWAYTQWPQRGDNHYVVKASGVEDMAPGQLAQALHAQGTTPKLAQ
jgi:hypothetical protein